MFIYYFPLFYLGHFGKGELWYITTLRIVMNKNIKRITVE